MTPRGSILGSLGVLIAACLTAFVGNGFSLPIDSHEAFVARTAEEMLARRSFLVPYLNDQYRLKKPPLSYWTVMAVDRLNGADGVITEAEARLPSAASGVILALLAASLGRMIGGWRTGVLAGLVLCSTSGYMTYTHSARPEMMYAMLCTAGAACWMRSWRLAAKASRPPTVAPLDVELAKVNPWWARLGWLFMGLAMLSKGPQLPLPIAAGFAIGLWATGRRREIVPTLRPASGVVIFLTASMWWYVAVVLKIPDAWGVWRKESLGRVAGADSGTSYLDPYYYYRTGQILVPWVALFVIATFATFMRELKADHRVRLLWWLMAAAMAGLSISLGRRDYYMLPMTAVAAALMASAGRWIGEVLDRIGKGWIFHAAAALHVLGFIAAIIERRATKPSVTAPPLWAVIATGAAGLLALAVILRQSRRAGVEGEREPWSASLVATCCAAAVMMAGAATRGAWWEDDRTARRQFCLDAKAIAPAGEPLLGWTSNWEIDQFYHHRVIPSFNDRKSLETALDGLELDRGAAAWLLVDARDDKRGKPLELPSRFHAEIALKAADAGKPSAIQLWRVTRALETP